MPKQCFLLFSRRNPMFTVLLKVQNRPKKPIFVPENLSIYILESKNMIVELCCLSF